MFRVTCYPMISKTESGRVSKEIPGSGSGSGTRWALAPAFSTTTNFPPHSSISLATSPQCWYVTGSKSWDIYIYWFKLLVFKKCFKTIECTNISQIQSFWALFIKEQSNIILLGNTLTLSKTRTPLISVAVLISFAFKITLCSSSKLCKCTKEVLSVYIQILTWHLWRMRTRLRSE